MQEQSTPEVRVGDVWRQDDGYLCRVVAITEEWVYARHASGRGQVQQIHPKWFEQSDYAWELVSRKEQRPWEGLAPGEWWAYPPRQLTGKPGHYHGYVTRQRKRAERLCHDGYHRSPEAALACAKRTAARLNRGAK